MLNFASPIDAIIFAVEVFGCISFAVSGAITALRKKADLLGVWVLTFIAVFGGGLLRDLSLQHGAPHIFWDPEYLWLAAISLAISTVCFVLACIPKTAKTLELHRHDFWLYLLDAIGIAVFCIGGVRVSYNALPDSIGPVATYIFCTTLGVVSGVGGGMFRDVFVGEIPMMFRKKFYTMPCIIGTTVYTIFHINSIGDPYGILAIVLSVSVIVGLRILATIFKWNMPTAKAFSAVLDEETKNKN